MQSPSATPRIFTVPVGIGMPASAALTVTFTVKGWPASTLVGLMLSMAMTDPADPAAGTADAADAALLTATGAMTAQAPRRTPVASSLLKLFERIPLPTRWLLWLPRARHCQPVICELVATVYE